jgi:predicted nucleic acid-binding protein
MPKARLDTDTSSEHFKGHYRVVIRRAADYARQDAASKQGSTIELPDCLIAAAAVRLGLPLVTGNTEGIEAIQRTGVALHIEN